MVPSGGPDVLACPKHKLYLSPNHWQWVQLHQSSQGCNVHSNTSNLHKLHRRGAWFLVFCLSNPKNNTVGIRVFTSKHPDKHRSFRVRCWYRQGGRHQRCSPTRSLQRCRGWKGCTVCFSKFECKQAKTKTERTWRERLAQSLRHLQ